MSVESIRELCIKGALRWTNHILVRLLQRHISRDDVKCAVMTGEILEQYTEDYPYPSCLIAGFATEGQPLHVVCGAGDGELWLITAYHPSEDEWTEDFKARKG